jgi:hypothetical protein
MECPWSDQDTTSFPERRESQRAEELAAPKDAVFRRASAERVGFSRAGSVPNLKRGSEARLNASPELADNLAEIVRQATTRASVRHLADSRRFYVTRRPFRMETSDKARHREAAQNEGRPKLGDPVLPVWRTFLREHREGLRVTGDRFKIGHIEVT